MNLFSSRIDLAVVIRICLLAVGVALPLAPFAMAPAAQAGTLPEAVCEADPSFTLMGPAGNLFAALVWNDGTGDALYAAGQFLAAGDAVANRIGKWNGASWSLIPGVGRVEDRALERPGMDVRERRRFGRSIAAQQPQQQRDP